MDDWGSYYGSDYDSYDSHSGGDYSFSAFDTPSSYDYSPSYSFNNDWLAPYAAPAPTYDYAPGGYDYSSWAPANDIQSGTGLQYDAVNNSWINSAGGQVGGSQPYSQGAIGAPGAATPLAQPQGGDWLSQLLRPQTLLGLGGGLASLIGTLSAGGQTGSSGPKPTTAQKAAIEQGNLMAALGAQGQLPAQLQQASLLQAIMSGQGLNQNYAQSVERAFDPALGDLYTRAAQQGRRRGFHDAPATSPPGGAILGPGLADIQGQQAAAKLKLMTDLPQLFNQPAQAQGSFAQNYLQAAQNAPMQQVTSAPLGAQIGQQLGGTLAGVGGGIQQAENQQITQAQYQSLIEALQGRQQPNASGAPSPGMS